MKHFSWKSIYPHLLAIGIFLLITIIYCKPALESGVTLVQSDITSVNGMAHQLNEHKKATGESPLWATNMFSGMPAFQIVYPLPFNPVSYIGVVLQLGLPKPFNFFFLACICFYILCMCIRLRPIVGIIAALAFAYCTYNPIIIGAGHDTKMLAMAYMPALLGSVILIYNKKYISGFILTAVFTCLELMQNHQQISYYIVIVIGIMTVSYMVQWIKAKEFKPMVIAVALALVAGIIGVLGNSTNLFTVADFAKESKRGGVLDMSAKNGKAAKTEGLTEEYAFQWSYGRMETFSLMFPGVQGYGLHYAQRDGDQYLFPKLDENSKTARYFQEKLNVGEDQAANIATQVSQSLYWGPQPFTNGPVYLGAVVCFLFILSLFIVDKKYTYWIVAASLLTIIMSWGANFAGFNNFLFKHLPFYNKFRVPTIILVVPQLLFALSAALALETIITTQNTAALWKQLKKGLIATGAVFAVVVAFYVTSDFSKENTQRTAAFNNIIKGNPADMQNAMRDLNAKFKPETDNQLYENFMFNTKGDQEISKGVLHALRQDRASLLGKDILVALVYVLLAFAFIYGFVERKINATVLLAGVGIVLMIDLLVMDSKYLNDKSYTVKEHYEEENFPMSAADKAILQDKDPNYRVYNMVKGDPFQDANTSYFHKSIGGYHPAKLGIYDDLITYQLSGKMNLPVLNMLNTKYIIQPGADNNPTPTQNPGALGNAWFVKGVHWVNGPAEEMTALDNFDPKDTAVLDNKYKSLIDGKFTADSAAVIRQTKFDNDAVSYECNSAAPQLAVFSEIYYKDWYAYIDGKQADVLKANYVLRALVVPAGKHTIEFKFEPKVYKQTYVLSTIAGWLMLLAFLGWLGKEIIAITKTEQATK
ncbi:hypothetical protein HNQ91_003742 [Filimonas zeae]|uniref:Membrane protein n=1 Tax=Filimonas zeae TaxID=1737353 RepID=A0A917J1C8_9BACT|nr:YfhO family protein [Filimonas zeae]MDR6340677.1 hypothetical protein [Filimonas zeae]GGH73854.1 membrane protein [Filimonas zeae]